MRRSPRPCGRIAGSARRGSVSMRRRLPRRRLGSSRRRRRLLTGEEAVSEVGAGEEPEPAYVAGTIQSGWRAGVRADRNMLGDPDAEIVITEWSDYQ